MNRRSPKRKGSTSKALRLWIVVMSIFIMELFFYTWCRVQCTKMGYGIAQIQNQYQELNTTQYNLKIELARLKSPERIARIAKEEFGLIMLTPEQMVTMP